LINLDNINSNKAQSQNLIQVHTTIPATTTAVELNVTEHKTIKNVPIVPNDRDVPIFLDNVDEEQYSFSNKANLKLK